MTTMNLMPVVNSHALKFSQLYIRLFCFNLRSLLATGLSHTKVSYLHDGALVVEYPFKMAITLETTPHPLLSTEHTLQVKRKLILPAGLVHRTEWRYYVRRETSDKNGRLVARVGRRMRVGKITPPSSSPSSTDTSLGHGYEGKVLLVCVTNSAVNNLLYRGWKGGGTISKTPLKEGLEKKG